MKIKGDKLINMIYETYKEQYELNLKEGEIKTTSKDKTIEILRRKYKDVTIRNLDINEPNANTFLIITDPVSFEEYKDILQYLNNLGWFISSIMTNIKNRGVDTIKPNENLVKKMLELPDLINMALSCEAKYDIKVENIPSILYHLTSTKYVDKIHKKGLIPRSTSKLSYHPERIYFTETPKDAVGLLRQMSDISGNIEFTVLQIDTSLIPGD